MMTVLAYVVGQTMVDFLVLDDEASLVAGWSSPSASTGQQLQQQEQSCSVLSSSAGPEGHHRQEVLFSFSHRKTGAAAAAAESDGRKVKRGNGDNAVYDKTANQRRPFHG